MKLLALSGVACLIAASQELRQLAEIKARVAADQQRLPNYTCTETIERSRRRPDSNKFQPLDRLRLEVALVNNKEMFGWPGGDRIEEDEITKLVSGTIGNGDFALLERAIFFTPDAVLGAPLSESERGRAVLRYEYRVPLAASGYHLRVPPKEAVVAYHGEFWVDAQSFELQRLELTVDAIPPFLGISAASNAIEFAPVEIGGNSFRLPRQTELKITDRLGWEHRNETAFRNCHQFTGESVLKFVEEGTEVNPTQAADETQAPPALPEQFLLDLALNETIDSKIAAIGDAVTAAVLQPLREGRTTLVPKGAVLRGRIDGMEQGEAGYQVHVLVTSIQFQKTKVDLTNRENQLWRIMQTSPSSAVRTPALRPAPGSILIGYGKLPAGTRLNLYSRAGSHGK